MTELEHPVAGKHWLACAAIVLSGGLACATAGGHPTAVKQELPASVDDPVLGLQMVFVKGGCYEMGTTLDAGGPEERPTHEVCVDDYYVGKYEVTQRQWTKVMGSNPSSHGDCGEDCPVEMVSWNDVQVFVERLNARSGGAGGPPGAYRLPTEAEWEYAARSGGKDEKYSGRSDDLGSVAWYLWNSEAGHPNAMQPHPVGLKAPNGLGIHDMTGNVWEWTSDWFGANYYATSPRTNPKGPGTGDRRVLRGGSFGDEAFDSRTSYRNHLPPDHRGRGKGFRLVRAAGAQLPAVPVPAAEGAAPAAAPPAPPPVVHDAVSGVDMVRVEGGCYRMGNIYVGGEVEVEEAQRETPVHEVCVDAFYLGKFEVTQGQWKSIMQGNPSTDATCKADDCPVDNVAWDDVQEFMRRLDRKAGKARYRLPTEAEWEYAARSGGRDERYSGGNDVDSVSWYQANSGRDDGAPSAHPVGTKAPNGLGIHDMSGNVYELTSDWFGGTYYATSPRTNPRGPKTGTGRVERGGCSSGNPGNSRVARRVPRSVPSGGSGFRLLMIP